MKASCRRSRRFPDCDGSQASSISRRDQSKIWRHQKDSAQRDRFMTSAEFIRVHEDIICSINSQLVYLPASGSVQPHKQPSVFLAQCTPTLELRMEVHEISMLHGFKCMLSHTPSSRSCSSCSLILSRFSFAGCKYWIQNTSEQALD